ncbi:MAG: PDZ domain-containing protein [Planctomycetota bacterium]|nr:MAG: PDZ domain-containing protein [Planctomycetota bacterium]
MLLTAMLACLFLLFELSSAQQPAPAPRTSLAQEVVRVPMSHETRMPVIEAKVNGQGPYRFILDTGAGAHGRLDRDLVAELKLEPVGEAQASDGTGVNTRSARLVGVDCVEVGGARFEGLTFLEGDYATRIPVGEPVVGILGYGLFAGLLWTVDYPGNAVELRRGELAAGAEHVLAYDDARGIATVPIRLGEHELRAHVDSGNMGGFMLPSEWMGKLRLAGPPVIRGSARTTNNEFQIRSAALEDALQFAGHSFQPAAADFAELFRVANLGYEVLKPFALTFDPKNRLLRVQRAGEGPLELRVPPPRFGLMLAPGEDSVRVDSVVAGSRAEKTGLKAGDVLLQVNGRDAGELAESGELGALLGSGGPVTLKLRRGEQELELVAPQ